MTKVTVVIPTIGRPQLTRAIESVKAQDYQNLEIIVVGPCGTNILPKGVIHLRGKEIINVCEARNIGTEAGTGVFTAYLDDDDFWMPNKISIQMEALAQHPSKTIIGCKYQAIGPLGTFVYPRELITTDQSIIKYLFGKNHLRPGLRYIQTSGIILESVAARRIGWDIQMRRHNDWDFFLRAQELGYNFHQLIDALVVVDQGGKESISRSRDPELSNFFYDRYVNKMSRKEKSTFLITAVFQNVINSKDIIKIIQYATKIISYNPTPKTITLTLLRIFKIRDALQVLRRFI